MAENEPAEIHLLPEGRLINHSLFVLDQFNDAAKPSYKVEIAFPKGTLDAINDKMLDFADDTWGDGAEDNVVLPIKDGDEMAAKREAKGKPGDAYKDCDILRASTQFNKHGEEGSGGVAVYGPDGESEIGPANKEEIWQGCYVIAGVTFAGYEVTTTGENAITLYLSAVQKTRDGERLVSQADHSKLFSPVGREKATSGKVEGGRRKRAG